MACGNEAVMKLRAHRPEVLFSRLISAQSTTDLVNFARGFISSVDMARITSSRGTMHIQIRVGEDIHAAFTKISDQQPHRGLALVRLLGRLLHNLHIMEFTLSRDKIIPQREVKGEDHCEKSCLATGKYNITQMLATEPELLSGQLNTPCLSWQEVTYPISSWGIHEAESNDILGRCYDLTQSTEDTNSVSFSDVVTGLNGYVSCQNLVTPSSTNHDVHSLSSIVTKSLTVCNMPNGIQPGVDKTTQSQMNKALFHKLSQIQFLNNESSMCQFVARSGICQVVSSSYTSFQSVSNKTDADSEVHVVRHETVFSKGNADRRYPLPTHLKLHENKGNHYYSSSDVETHGLELVAVGGQTVELPVGETIQILPYSSGLCPEQNCKSCMSPSACVFSLRKQDEIEKKRKECKDSELDLAKSLQNATVSRCDGKVYEFGTPISDGSESPSQSMWSHDPKEHIEYDEDTGKTFFSL